MYVYIFQNVAAKNFKNKGINIFFEKCLKLQKTLQIDTFFCILQQMQMESLAQTVYINRCYFYLKKPSL